MPGVHPVKHRPRHLVGANLKRTLGAQRRAPVLLGGKQPAGHEPGRQRSASLLEDRAGRRRTALMALAALIPPICQAPRRRPTASSGWPFPTSPRSRCPTRQRQRPPAPRPAPWTSWTAAAALPVPVPSLPFTEAAAAALLERALGRFPQRAPGPIIRRFRCRRPPPGSRSQGWWWAPPSR